MTHHFFHKTILFTIIVFGCFAHNVAANDTNMDQGWSDQERSYWYSETQGSRLLPFSWFNTLEQAQSARKFRETPNLMRFGFLTSEIKTSSGLPIGLVIDRQDDTQFINSGLRWYEGQAGSDWNAEQWVGLNCAACHTTQINVGEEILTIDGGTSLLDLQSFINELDVALAATATNKDKFDRFAAGVLGDKDTQDNREKLNDALGQLVAWQNKMRVMNEPSTRYGFGRLDAIGRIFNKALMFNGADESAGNPANAPVSFPFLWNAWRQKQVQWNGMAENTPPKNTGLAFDLGALGRNAGQVLGVFGEVVIKPRAGSTLSFKGYKSSVHWGNLQSFETMLRRLAPPSWPATLEKPAIGELVQGKEVFRNHCAGCHQTPEMQKASVKTERMISFQKTLARAPENLTDILSACNSWSYEGPTGPLEGVKDGYGTPLSPTAPVAYILNTQVNGALLNEKLELYSILLPNFSGIRKPPLEIEENIRQAVRDRCLSAKNQPILAYKARPLDGIWATAPYLHNGSVASLYELLLPADERLKSFWVGNRSFDAQNVGYLTTDPGNGMGFLFRVFDDASKAIEGNSNAGHEYGAADLSKADRQALIAYLKML